MSLTAGILAEALLLVKQKQVKFRGKRSMRNPRDDHERLARLGGRGIGAARERLDEAAQGISESFEDLGTAAATWVKRRPLETVLVTFGGGLLLGRFKVRPLEAVCLSALTGIACGLLLYRSSPSWKSGRKNGRSST